MKTTKTILTLAVIVALPFGAMADYTYNYVDTPAKVANNRTVRIADNSAPFADITIEVDDENHIASTAYVKGAYNDAIAAINRLNDDMEGKQAVLYSNETGSEITTQVAGPNELIDRIATKNMSGAEDELATVDAIGSAILSQRVKIYTTWDDDSDSATTHVLLDTVLPDED